MTPYRERNEAGYYKGTDISGNDITVHEPIPDEADDNPIYPCPNCDSTFKTKRGLSRHKTAKH